MPTEFQIDHAKTKIATELENSDNVSKTTITLTEQSGVRDVTKKVTYKKESLDKNHVENRVAYKKLSPAQYEEELEKPENERVAIGPGEELQEISYQTNMVTTVQITIAVGGRLPVTINYQNTLSYLVEKLNTNSRENNLILNTLKNAYITAKNSISNPKPPNDSVTASTTRTLTESQITYNPLNANSGTANNFV